MESSDNNLIAPVDPARGVAEDEHKIQRAELGDHFPALVRKRLARDSIWRDTCIQMYCYMPNSFHSSL